MQPGALDPQTVELVYRRAGQVYLSDFDSLESAVGFLHERQGGVINLPPGVVRYDRPIRIDGPVPVTLRGCGAGAELLAGMPNVPDRRPISGTQLHGPGITLRAAYRAKPGFRGTHLHKARNAIENLSIVGGGLVLEDSHHTIIRDVTILKCPVGLRMTHSYYGTIDGVYVVECGDGIVFDNANATRVCNTSVRECKRGMINPPSLVSCCIEANTECGIVYTPEARYIRSSLHDVYFEANGEADILGMEGCDAYVCLSGRSEFYEVEKGHHIFGQFAEVLLTGAQSYRQSPDGPAAIVIKGRLVDQAIGSRLEHVRVERVDVP